MSRLADRHCWCCGAGRLQTRNWEADGITRYITEVICEDVILLGGGGDRAPHPASEEARPASGPAPGPDMGVGEDDVPF